ncbi:hypothetical protein Q4517_01130 [Tenacibaculum sp. 1_MG-2023]|uniref:hypothetical protein n=1 Tax=Tenacibaculum sp. 1_MG-2023 TaxID=3062653 RepID=UPI0026E2652B|nr:hypothetical protein [Tenacibaculum sp. 1_MG-2023]MDO6674150.1 hypothetical protein [Tenacibaculum sp. 1_MG-2023]
MKKKLNRFLLSLLTILFLSCSQSETAMHEEDLRKELGLDLTRYQLLKSII